jgi:putative ABC transport system ATP-binding protein
VIVELHGVSRTFRRGSERVTAVRGASLDLTPATLVVVRGPSGSGKTTLLNLVLGWEEPDEGTVVRDTGTDLPAVLPQRLGLLDHLTVAENVGLPLRAGRSRVAAVGEAAAHDPDDLLRRLDLDHLARRFPPETSLGEQQRTACARAVVAGRSLLVADEPTSHQDGAHAAAVVDELVGAARAGAAVLVATHDERVTAHADRCLTIVDGVLSAG